MEIRRALVSTSYASHAVYIVITKEDEQVIDVFLEDVAKMDLHKFGMQTISTAFEKPCVRNECKDPIEEVKRDIWLLLTGI